MKLRKTLDIVYHICCLDILPVPIFECRIVGTTFKEVGVGHVQVPQGLLQGNTRDFLEPDRALFFLQGRDSRAQVLRVEFHARLEVGPFAFVECPVVDETRTAKCLSKVFHLLISRIEPISVRSFLHLLALLLLLLKPLFNQPQSFHIEGTLVFLSRLAYPLKQVKREVHGHLLELFLGIHVVSIAPT